MAQWRPSPASAALAAAVLALGLLLYVFGFELALRVLTWVAVGAFVGWLGSLVLRTDTQEGILLDIVAGGAGALGGLLLFGAISQGGPLERFLSSVVGSAVLVAIPALLRRNSRR